MFGWVLGTVVGVGFVCGFGWDGLTLGLVGGC